MNSTVAQMNSDFGLGEELVCRDAGDGFIVIDVSNEHCSASIALQGAHLMTWQPMGEKPVIWMSPVATLAKGKSIRGGVPVCWPWFGPHESNPDFPSHGFARTVPWQVIGSESLDGGSTRISFRLSEFNTDLWPCEVVAEIHMVIGRELELELVTINDNDEVMTVGDALHTYFNVGDTSQISIQGLEGCDYLDKVDGSLRKEQKGDVTIDREVDRIYLDRGEDVVIDDPVMGRRIRIEKRESRSTVVWNPWINKCRRMGDFGSDDGYLGMVCVESANAAEDVFELAPGESHRLWVRYSIEKS